MPPRVGLLVAATLAAIVAFAISVLRQWPTLEMVAGLTMLFLVALLAFVVFLLSIFRSPRW